MKAAKRRAFFYLSPLDLTSFVRHVPTTDEQNREALAGDEVMVHGIDYTSVSPVCVDHGSLGSLEWCTSFCQSRIVGTFHSRNED